MTALDPNLDRDALLARLAALPAADLAALGELAGSLPAPPLQLTPEPSPAHGDGGISRQQLMDWAEKYGTQHRQLRRWIARGRERNDPCPLDSPAQMPGWIERNVEKIRGDLRARINGAAEQVRQASPAAPLPDLPAPASTPSLDLSTVGGVEGESVLFYRDLFAAVKLQLKEAYLTGTELTRTQLHARLEKVGESLRKHEAAAEAKAKRSGSLLEKSEVITEVTQAINALRCMREHMAKRIVAELTGLDPATAEQLRAAIERVREREDDVFRNIGALKSPLDVQFALAA